MMRKIFLTICILLGMTAICAQNTSTDVRTMIVKTSDGNVTKFNLSDVEELSFSTEPADAVTVTRLLNLTPNHISIVGLEENQTLSAGTKAELILKAGSILSNQFQDYHFEHIHVQVNDQVIVPAVPEGYAPTDEMMIPFTVPSGDCDIVVCYSGQQQMIETGYTMTMEANPNVKMYGVSPNHHYKYFDAYLLTDEAFVITDAEFKMGDDDWKPVNGTTGCFVRPSDNLPNLYEICIRPDYQNVTGDVLVRVSGEQHHRYNITWINADAEHIDLEKSTLPTEAIDGDVVTAELYINEAYYLAGASATGNTEVKPLYGAYVQFTMPASDIDVTLDFQKKIPVTVTASEHVAEAHFYNAPDIYYGWVVDVATPGEETYIIASAEEGYKPMTATTDAGDTYTFTHYGLDMYLCRIPVPADAKSLSASITCAKAWSVSSKQVVQCDNGSLYAEGETVNFSVQVPGGKQVESVTAKTASGHDVAVTFDSPYGTFVMPAEDVAITVTYADLEAGNTVSVIAYFDEDEYDVSSSTNYDWDFAEGFTVDKGATFYLSVYGYYGEEFYVGVKIGETVQTFPAIEDEDSGEFSFGKAFVADGDMTIKVGPTAGSVAF